MTFFYFSKPNLITTGPNTLLLFSQSLAPQSYLISIINASVIGLWLSLLGIRRSLSCYYVQYFHDRLPMTKEILMHHLIFTAGHLVFTLEYVYIFIWLVLKELGWILECWTWSSLNILEVELYWGLKLETAEFKIFVTQKFSNDLH